MFVRRKTATKSNQYWRDRERSFAKARAMEASFFLLAFTIVLGVASWWLSR